MFEDFIEDVNGVKAVRLDGLTYINDKVALVAPTKTKNQRMHELWLEHYRKDGWHEPIYLDRRVLGRYLALHMPSQQLQQIGLRVRHVPTRRVEERRMQRTLKEEKTIVVTPETKDYVQFIQSFGSDKEIVMITEGLEKDNNLVQLITVGGSKPLPEKLTMAQAMNIFDFSYKGHQKLGQYVYEFMHGEEPVISSSFIDAKTSKFLFETAGRRGRHSYGRMHNFFKRYFSAEHTYKRLLQQLKGTPTIEQVQKRQDLLQSFIDTGTNKLESLKEKISGLETTSNAIIKMAPNISVTIQHHRGKRGNPAMKRFFSEHYCLKETVEALESLVELPDTLEFPKSNDVSLAKVKRGVNDVLSKENPNGFQNFVEYAKKLSENIKPGSFESFLSALKRDENDTKLYDGASRFVPPAYYMKRALSWLDLQRGLAEVGIKEGWSFSKVVPKEQEIIDIEGGYYPFMVEEKPSSSFFDIGNKQVILPPDKIVKNPTYLDKDTRVELVSGSNFNGKSCYVMHVPTVQIFGQTIGLVPASKAVISHKDRVIVRLKRRGEVEHNESAFSGEINEINSLLNTIANNGRHTLITLDEYLTSTNPYDGESILYGFIKEGVIPSGAKLLVTHHYPRLNELAEESPIVTSSGFIPDRDGEKVIMNYRKTPNTTETYSFGVQVAQQLGLSKHIVDSAKERLEKIS